MRKRVNAVRKTRDGLGVACPGNPTNKNNDSDRKRTRAHVRTARFGIVRRVLYHCVFVGRNDIARGTRHTCVMDITFAGTKKQLWRI